MAQIPVHGRSRGAPTATATGFCRALPGTDLLLPLLFCIRSSWFDMRQWVPVIGQTEMCVGLTTIQKNTYHGPHCTDEETKARRSYVTCRRQV